MLKLCVIYRGVVLVMASRRKGGNGDGGCDDDGRQNSKPSELARLERLGKLVQALQHPSVA